MPLEQKQAQGVLSGIWIIGFLVIVTLVLTLIVRHPEYQGRESIVLEWLTQTLVPTFGLALAGRLALSKQRKRVSDNNVLWAAIALSVLYLGFAFVVVGMASMRDSLQPYTRFETVFSFLKVFLGAAMGAFFVTRES